MSAPLPTNLAHRARVSSVNLPLESVAECVASVLSDACVRSAGRPKGVDAFVQAATVRLVGLRGHGDEEGVLSDALNVHLAAEAQARQAGIFPAGRPLATS